MITLRPYQEAGAQTAVQLLKTRRLAYLAFEVRTGKTLTAFRAVQLLGSPSCLFITKKKAIASIEADAQAIGVACTVTNYEQVPKLKQRSWGIVIIDEAHGIGAYPKPSKRWKDIRALSTSMHLLLSGTPSPESYSQLFHQFTVGAGPWSGNFYRWADKYVNKKEKFVGYGKTAIDYSGAKEAEVLRDVSPYMIRMTQQAAGFEQTIKEVVHKVEMKPRTYRMAKRIMKDGVIGTPRCRSVLADTGAKVMSKLHQLYSGTIITEDHGPIQFDRSKVDYIKKQFAGRKIAILYKFDAEGKMLRSTLHNVVDTPEAFNADPSATYVGQVQSSREGVNLSTAECIVMYSIDYSALSYLQGRDRASYLGRETPPEVHWIFADRSIESKVYRTVKGKEDYTLAHYKNDRISIPNEIDQGVHPARMVLFEADPNEQERYPGPITTEAERSCICRGKECDRRIERGAKVPA